MVDPARLSSRAGSIWVGNGGVFHESFLARMRCVPFFGSTQLSPPLFSPFIWRPLRPLLHPRQGAVVGETCVGWGRRVLRGFCSGGDTAGMVGTYSPLGVSLSKPGWGQQPGSQLE